MLAVDLPGHGESSKGPGDYSLGSLASTLRDLLDVVRARGGVSDPNLRERLVDDDHIPARLDRLGPARGAASGADLRFEI